MGTIPNPQQVSGTPNPGITAWMTGSTNWPERTGSLNSKPASRYLLFDPFLWYLFFFFFFPHIGLSSNIAQTLKLYKMQQLYAYLSELSIK